ncbi:hypothetical protein BO221_43950 [Archangium sp. Cb G35]|uniref:hypothetical protein n=1 Tax=Archangium sp. Cb G35 TaxID=1920190 RepID=UPI0009377004|nr:hypothetical protein [Archangium sp. Cb G35]OJT17946.1 hypothetical protein BO221_43950 [Archangium sp. Cb G35]
MRSLVLAALVVTGCSSLGQARRRTVDDCVALDRARQRWAVVELAALGLGAGSGVATLTPLMDDPNARLSLGVTAVGAGGLAAFAA